MIFTYCKYINDTVDDDDDDNDDDDDYDDDDDDDDHDGMNGIYGIKLCLILPLVNCTRKQKQRKQQAS